MSGTKTMNEISKPERSKLVQMIDSWQGSAPPETWRAFYVRVTAEESVKKDLSIPNQIARAHEIARERGWHHYRVYVELRHVSAEEWADKRPALRLMLDDAAAGRVSAVCARHLDRLWRNNVVQSRLLDVLRQHRVEVWDFTKQHEYKSAHGNFTLQVLGAASELEVKLTAERIREMKRAKARKGKLAGGPPPFGYTSQSRRKLELIAAGASEDEAYRKACLDFPVGKTWYIDEKEAEIVRLAFDLCVSPEKRLGSLRIAHHLNARGLRTRNGRVWFAGNVSRMLVNPVYAGYTTFDEAAYVDKVPSSLPRRKQERFKGEHPALVSADVWELAQKIRTEENGTKRVRSGSHEVFSLAGLLQCPKCGHNMLGKYSDSRSRRYYMCTVRHSSGVDQCDFPLIDARALQSGVWRYLHEILSSPEYVIAHLERMREKLGADVPDVTKQLASNERQQAKTRAAMAKYFGLIEESKDPARDVALLERVRELRAELASLEGAHAELQAKAAPLPQHAISAEHVTRYLMRLRERVDGRPELQRAVFQEFRRLYDLRVRALSTSEFAVSISLRAHALLDSETPIDDRLIAVFTSPSPSRGRREGGPAPRAQGSGNARSEPGSVGAGANPGSVGAGYQVQETVRPVLRCTASASPACGPACGLPRSTRQLFRGRPGRYRTLRTGGFVA